MARSVKGGSRDARYGRENREAATVEGGHTAPPATDEQSVNAREGCPACDGELVLEDDERYCEECGLIVAEDRVDHGPEWRSFDDDDSEDGCRVGSPMTAARHDRGLSTTFRASSDANGNALSGSKQSRFHRLKKWHKRTVSGTKADRNLIDGFTKIRLVVSGLNLGNSLRDRACNIFRRAQDRGLLKGSSIEACAAAAVYAACRVEDVPRKRDEAASYVEVDDDDVKTSYKRMNTELGLKTIPPRPLLFVPRILTELSIEISPEKRKEMLDIATWAADLNMAQSRKPAGFAGGIVYRQLDGVVTQTRIAEVAGTSESCIRSAKEQINEMLEDHGDYVPIRIYRIAENKALSAGVRERAQTLYDEAAQPDGEVPVQSYYGATDVEQAGRRALAAVTAACRDLEVPRRVEDLTDGDEADPTQLRIDSRELLSAAGRDVQRLTPSTYIPRVLEEANLEGAISAHAREEVVALAEQAETDGVSEHADPYEFAAATVAYATPDELVDVDTLGGMLDLNAGSLGGSLAALERYVSNLEPEGEPEATASLSPSASPVTSD